MNRLGSSKKAWAAKCPMNSHVRICVDGGNCRWSALGQFAELCTILHFDDCPCGVWRKGRWSVNVMQCIHHVVTHLSFRSHHPVFGLVSVASRLNGGIESAALDSDTEFWAFQPRKSIDLTWVNIYVSGQANVSAGYARFKLSRVFIKVTYSFWHVMLA